MKIDILNKEETHKIRHLALTLQAEDVGRSHKVAVTMVENYDSRHNSYTYDIESFSWLTSQEGINARDFETKIEDYLIDNVEDIFR